MEVASYASAKLYHAQLNATNAANRSGGRPNGSYSSAASPPRSVGLQRPPTAPAMYAAQSSLVQSQAHTGSNYSIQSQPSSRSSGTTQGTTQSTLFPPPMPIQSAATSNTAAMMSAPAGNDVTPNDNIMNSVADAGSSLFQLCVALRQRLNGCPGCAEALDEAEHQSDADTDPVTLLWNQFRFGPCFVLLYDALRQGEPMILPANGTEEKRGKAATFKFLQACMTDLKFAQPDLFIITDLFSNDTTGFSRVVKALHRVLDEMVRRNLIADVRPTASDFEQATNGMKRTQRQHIVAELVSTERTYVQHLELLQAFKRMVEEKGIIPGDKCHDIFLNLNSLLDFQRRFLIRVEQTNALPEDEQNWGALFKLYKEAFKVYEPYIGNQAKCERTVVAEFPKLKEAGGSIEMRQMVESSAALYGFLMKPFQRLSKYPLLLDDLYKKGDLDEQRKQDLQEGREAATSVLARTNQAIDREQRLEAVEDLKVRVEDWKGHKVDGFGELLLHGTFTVLKSENLANGKDAERQYHVYLFETILLCCKNIDPLKPKNLRSSNRNTVENRGKPKLQLKGRIFMQNVTDLVSLAKPGSYTCQIFWKGDPGIENFIIRFTTEEALKKWAAQIEIQRRKYRESSSHSHARHSDSNRSHTSGTSNKEFVYLQNQPPPENPYKHDAIDEDDDDDEDAETLAGSASGWSNGNGSVRDEYPRDRNGSSASLRSRSTTGESTQASMSSGSTRAAPMRFPTGSFQQLQQQAQQQPPLALRTRDLQHPGAAPSPGAQNMESYFSPTGESPASSARISAGSGMYPFPAQQVPQNGYYGDGHNATRFTAPAMPRQPPQRELSGGLSNGYAPPGRGPVQRPGFPGAMHGGSTQGPAGSRNRSASSPDIHNPSRIPGRGAQPPIPDMPASYQHPSQHMINRSQNNSPSMGPPGRASPALGRERLYSNSGSRVEQSPTEYSSYGGAAPTRQDHSRVMQQQQQQYYPNRTMTPVSRAPSQQAGYSPPRAVPGSSHPPASAYAPPAANTSFQDSGGPAQLRVKVNCPAADVVLTLVVPTTITYASLRDRIDAKLQRSTQYSLSDRGPREGQVKLKYLDDDDFVSIGNDGDVQTAFEAWREANFGAGVSAAQAAQMQADGGFGMGGLLGEIELFCQR